MMRYAEMSAALASGGMTEDLPAYRVVYSQRRSIALVIERDATLTVRAPQRTSARRIAALVKEKQRWIQAKQRQAQQAAQLHPCLRLIDGERVLYLGRAYVISRTSRSAAITLTADGQLLLPEQCSQAELIVWFKRAARRLISERVRVYQMAAEFSSIRITSARTRWGSCSASNALSFSWRLVMCPLPVIDYVVVHELTHIRHKNHAAEFWQSVAAILPDYRGCQQWLKDNRRLMQVL